MNDLLVVVGCVLVSVAYYLLLRYRTRRLINRVLARMEERLLAEKGEQ